MAPNQGFRVEILTYEFCAKLINDVLKEWSHAALHDLLSLMSPGTIGPTGTAMFLSSWTAVKLAPLQRGVLDHFKNYDEVSEYARAIARGEVEPRGIGPRFPSLLDAVIRDGCPRCFRFFVGRKIISAEGYDHWGRSYLKMAIDGEKWNLAAQIIQFLPLGDFDSFTAVEVSPFAPVTQPSRILYEIAVDARPTRIWVERRYNHEMAQPAAFTPIHKDCRDELRRSHKLIPWIDVQTAQMLFVMQFDVSIRQIGGNEEQGGVFYQMIVERRNPNRYSLMKWMSGKNGKPGLNDAAITMGVYGVSLDRWPPWFVAIKKGDWVLASRFSADPAVNPLVLGWDDGLAGAAPTQHPIGLGALHHLNNQGVNMLRQWLFRARNHPGWYPHFVPHVLNLMRDLLVETSKRRRDIRYVLSTSRARADARRSQLNAAVKMIRLLIDESFYQVRPDEVRRDGDIEYIRTLADVPEYKQWVEQMKSERSAMPGIPELFIQLEKPTGVYAHQSRNR